MLFNTTCSENKFIFVVAYAQIDWHDFVVVETVDFQQNEPGNFPPPTTPEEVGARLLAQERFESNPIRVGLIFCIILMNIFICYRV